MKSPRNLPLMLVALLMAGMTGLHAEDQLKNEFQKPPASARPWVFYFVVGANMTKEGITADFEAMARVGIGGLIHMEVVHDAPQAKGSADYASPQWMELIKHACNEAHRLGLQINMTNGPRWTGSSGAWITPALSMQKVVWTEMLVEGGKKFNGRLEKPASVKNYYQDIAVLAFPTPTAEAVNMGDAAPKITSSGTNPKSGQFTLERPEPNKVQHVQIEFATPFTASALAAKLSGSGWAAVSGELQVSDDGQSFKPVQAFAVHAPVMTLNFPRVTARFFRVVFSKNEDRKPTSLEVSNFDLNQRYRIEGVEGKASFDSWKMPPAPANWPSAQADAVIPRDRILDLSDKMDADGKLSYDFPAGRWTVLRFGHTTTGTENGPAWPATARGLESDKFSKEASKAMFNGLMGRLVAENKDLTGPDKTLVATHIDSWEIHSQNWTPLMREEFRKRRGYDPLKFLPAFTGRVVDKVESTERFLWDFRQTVSDLVVDNYAGEMRRLANQHGLRLSIEAYDGPAADLPYGGQADEPVAEFWAWTKYRGAYCCTEMSSAAHTYGKKILSAEAFTAEETEKWQGHPANIKDLGDWAFCEGINRFVFHRYAAQTWMQASPGIALGPWGLHYERTQTWWEQSKAWHEYLARCQYLLQQGLFVADVAYLQQEGAPYALKIPAGAEIAPHIRGGYNFDGCSPDVVLERMSVKNGRIVLPDGMSYAVLVVPETETMTPKLLNKISQMVDQGALVIAGCKPPQKSPSLGDMGSGDDEVKTLADELWSSGKIITGKTAAEVLGARGVKPDFSATPILRYIHRTIGDAEVYFVANPEPKEVVVTAAFRITGKQPEFWWPESGRTEPVNDFEIKDGITRIPLRLDPSGSVFVIFREATKVSKGTGKNWVDAVPVQEIAGPWEIAFDPKWGGPAKVTFEKLEDWSKRPEEGIKYYSGTAIYRTTFDSRLETRDSRLETRDSRLETRNSKLETRNSKLFLDLGRVAVMAEVTLNGKGLGVLWKPPYRVEVTDALQPGANQLEVTVVNLFINRQIGDEQLPEDSDRFQGGYYDGKAKSWPQWLQEGKSSPTGRFTFSSWRLWKKTDPLSESGLLGPVTIQATEVIKLSKTSKGNDMKYSNLSHFALVGLMALSTASAAETAIPIDGKDTGRIFDGIGALSAGASSRLLIDYPEPQRGEILDYLFKPNFGAALQINKVEIGGDMNSTDGSEPSHMRTRDDENYNRGYEWWLMKESKKRNPQVKLYGLQWGAPNWINPAKNDIWTQDNITFLLNWVRGAKTHHNLTLDYLGGWNERPGNPGWFVDFRKALDKAGLKEIQIVADDQFQWKAASVMATNPDYAASVQIIGSHYPGYSPGKDLEPNLAAGQKTGKPLWASEAGSADYHDGAANLAVNYNREYISGKVTSFINWSTIWSVFPGLPYSGNGLMLANTPWSGYYEVGKSIWATAHTTQFARPGWRYLDRACGYFGGDAGKGSYVTLAAPNRKDYSLIVETLHANQPQTATFTVARGLSARALHVWKTDLRSKKTEDWFIQQPDLSLKKRSFTATFQPGCVYSLTTTTGQAKGVTTPPPPAMLSLPYHDDFQSYEIGKTPKYLSDQHGTFEVAPAGGGRQGKCLRQTVTAKPVCWNGDADPGTVVGDPLWKNYQVSSDVLLEQPGTVELVGRLLGTQTQNRMMGYRLRVNNQGHWSLIVVYDPKEKTDPKEKELAAGDVAALGVGKWHKLSLSFVGSRITASVDDVVVADGVNDTTYDSGLVGYQANRWQTAEFMNFSVVPLGSDPYVRFTGNLAKEGAKVIACDSQDPEYPAELAIDGTPGTFWHTAWKPTPAPLPHFLAIDLGKTRTIQSLTCTPRQDQSGCRIADCEVYLSDDSAQWGLPAATVKLKNESTAQKIRFEPPATGRYLKVVIKSTQAQNNPNVAIAELGIIE